MVNGSQNSDRDNSLNGDQSQDLSGSNGDQSQDLSGSNGDQSRDLSGSNNTNNNSSRSPTGPQKKSFTRIVTQAFREGYNSGKNSAIGFSDNFIYSSNPEKTAYLQDRVGEAYGYLKDNNTAKNIFISVAILSVIMIVIFMSIYMRMYSEGIKKNSETIENIVDQIEESKEDQKQETQPEKKSYIEEYILVGAIVSLIIYFYFFQDSGTVFASKKAKKSKK